MSGAVAGPSTIRFQCPTRDGDASTSGDYIRRTDGACSHCRQRHDFFPGWSALSATPVAVALRPVERKSFAYVSTVEEKRPKLKPAAPATDLDFATIRPVWHTHAGETRLIFYDIFRGLLGKVWALAPLFATAWTETNCAKPTFNPLRPPLPLLSTRNADGFISDVFIDQRDHHYLYSTQDIHPKVMRFNWQMILFEFDVVSDAETVVLHYTVPMYGERCSAVVALPAIPPRRFFCTEATLTRDDNEILGEWLTHHEELGFDRFHSTTTGACVARTSAGTPQAGYLTGRSRTFTATRPTTTSAGDGEMASASAARFRNRRMPSTNTVPSPTGWRCSTPMSTSTFCVTTTEPPY